MKPRIYKSSVIPRYWVLHLRRERLVYYDTWAQCMEALREYYASRGYLETLR